MKDTLFDIDGKVACVTGGGGVLCGTFARALAARRAKVAVADLNRDAAEQVAEDIRGTGGTAQAFTCNVLERDSIEAMQKDIEQALGPVDILVNGAGGNRPDATASDTLSFFDIPADALRFVVDLNLIGSVLPSQVFGKGMAERDEGVIVNISSMNAIRPLTRIIGYSAAKAAINNFTQWLAVHIGQNYSQKVRVNAIAPGFFLTEQNRFLLQAEDGGLTPRGRQVVAHTPMGRFGEPDDLVGTLLWLVSPASAFVHGVVVPVDGGFSAFSGV